jgi:hypothetical protein
MPQPLDARFYMAAFATAAAPYSASWPGLTRPSMKLLDRDKLYGLNLWNVIMDRRVKPGDDEL